MMKYIPPLSDAFENVGMELPPLLGKKKEEPKEETEKKPEAEDGKA